MAIIHNPCNPDLIALANVPLPAKTPVQEQWPKHGSEPGIPTRIPHESPFAFMPLIHHMPMHTCPSVEARVYLCTCACTWVGGWVCTIPRT